MAETGSRLRAGIAIVAMMALYAAGYAWSAAHMDTADELLQAVPTAYQWSGLDRYWRKKDESETGTQI